LRGFLGYFPGDQTEQFLKRRPRTVRHMSMKGRMIDVQKRNRNQVALGPIVLSISYPGRLRKGCIRRKRINLFQDPPKQWDLTG
jgi:hypothetical protein